MFVRRRTNRSGSISIFVVDKSRGRYDTVKSFGAVKTKAEADLIENKAREWIRSQEGEQGSLFGAGSEQQLREEAAALEQGRLELAGPELIYGALFDRLALGPGMDSLFRHIVVCRLCNPGSKSRTAGYLRRYLGESCGEGELYRVVDCLKLTDLRTSPSVPVSCLQIPSPLPRIPFLLLVDAEGRPVAGRLADRRTASREAVSRTVRRLARKYGAAGDLPVLKGDSLPQGIAYFFRMGKKDAGTRPLLRRKRGRAEGHLAVCMAAFAIQVELQRLLAASAPDISLSQVREAASTMFRVNYISPYTRRPKSVLANLTPLQKSLLDMVQG
ncbi:MAG: hypothetical protein K6G79_01325 [Bacteroidales bacterium]|nr:hypothetical protein [Bacteroidales bacterium]